MLSQKSNIAVGSAKKDELCYQDGCAGYSVGPQKNRLRPAVGCILTAATGGGCFGRGLSAVPPERGERQNFTQTGHSE
jgi:hypothetical protein